MKIETVIKLNKFKPRPYQAPIWDAIENKGYKRVLAILPRRAGKDVTAFNLCIRECLRRPCVIFYIFPTYSQGKKVLWDSITNTGERILDYVPDELVESKNSTELKIRFKNGSLFQIVGSDNFDCFDSITEILTEDGWKLFKDLNSEDKVASLVDDNLEFVVPNKHVAYDFNGEMYKIFNSSIDMLVTPNHRFYVKSSKNIYKFKEISDPTIIHDSIPSTCGWKGIITDIGFPTGIFKSLEDTIAFMGIFLSEGSTFKNSRCYRVIISQTKPNVCEKIKDLLERNNINYVKAATGFNIENRSLYEYCAQFGKQEFRFIPKQIKQLPVTYLRILFDWLIVGDGHQCNNYTAYYSCSKKLIDDVQEIIIKLGASGNIYIRPQKKSIIRGRIIHHQKILYEIRVRTSLFKRFQSSIKDYISKEYYKGKVYCVSVDTGIIKVRRNGKECWSGNSLMGTNPQGVVFSEYSLQDPRAYQYIRPILTANQGWALFLSTPRGKNHLWELYQIAQRSPQWYCYKLTVEDTGHISLHEIEKERADGLMSEDLIQQEYYTSFTMGVEGSYYAKYIDKMRLKSQIGMMPYEVGFKVHTAWDLGVRDSTVIIFFQVIGQTIRIIDYYENSKQGMEHYITVIKQKEYIYGRHIAPHDIKIREFTSGVSRIEKARQLGISFVVAPDLSIEDGIEAVRTTLGKCWIDDVKCALLIKALENYRQEYDIRHRVYKSQPLHDWSSHAADAMRYLAISLPKVRDGLSPEELDKRYNEARYGIQSNLPSIFRDDLPQY